MKATGLLALLVVVVAVLSTTPARATDWIYATVSVGANSDNHLFRINVNTGATVDIGFCTIPVQPGHKPGLTGLSRHTDGQLYAFDTYGNQIITIDTITALGTPVTPVGADLGGWMFGLAIEPTGDYYVTGRQLRKGTLPGPTVPIGSEHGDTDSCDLAPDGTLYATNADDGNALLTINKTTGEQILIRTWSDVDIAGIAIDGPIAWAIDNEGGTAGGPRLVSIDLSTGDLTYSHLMPEGYYLATAVPEPATLLLLGLGGAALLTRRRKG